MIILILNGTPGWSGIQIQDMDFIPYPWLNPRTKEKGAKQNKFNGKEVLEISITDGLYDNFTGVKGRDVVPSHLLTPSITNKLVYKPNTNNKPTIGLNWADYVYIEQPPTYNSWGIGRIYIDHADGHITYMSIRLAPFGEQIKATGSITAPSIVSSSTTTTTGTFDFNLNSELDLTNYEIIDVKNATVNDVTTNAIAGKTYSGSVPITINIPGNSVIVEMTIKCTNNIGLQGFATATATITKIRDFEGTPLGYNILSRDYRFQMTAGPLTASVSKPYAASWDGNGTGTFNVTNNDVDLFRSFYAEGAGSIDEGSESVTRHPWVNMSIQRTDFGDNPLGNAWLNPGNPDIPLNRIGTIDFGGTYSRTYYTEEEDEFEVIHKTYDSDSSFFPGGTYTGSINVYTYNGMPIVPPKTYIDSITSNTSTSLKKDLKWESESYSFDAIRWMYNQDADGNLYNPTAVDGQYERTFTNQCAGSVAWKSSSTMSTDYFTSRNAAKNNTSVKSQYDKAVFATEKEFKTVAYPIKSGYYFNPTGTYEFTVQTVVYKKTTADAAEHKALVDDVIDSFHYESDMMYINSSKQAVNLQNVILTKSGNSYVKKSASLTAADPTGVNGVVLLEVEDRSDDNSRYTKVTEEVLHSESITGTTDLRFKNILEGYSESGTLGSNTDYKYREYIEDRQRLYKVTETTVVTINMNPDNLKVYTHALMKDGEYQVRVWIDDVDLNGSYEYDKLDDIEGIGQAITSGNTYLDNIKINVKGSMVDDIN